MREIIIIQAGPDFPKDEITAIVEDEIGFLCDNYCLTADFSGPNPTLYLVILYCGNRCNSNCMLMPEVLEDKRLLARTIKEWCYQIRESNPRMESEYRESIHSATRINQSRELPRKIIK